MIKWDELCCVCLEKRRKLEKLSRIQENNLSYDYKLSVLIPQMDIDGIRNVVYICGECEARIDTMYNFRNTCLSNNVKLWESIKKSDLDANRMKGSIVSGKSNERNIQERVDNVDDERMTDFEKINIKTEFVPVDDHDPNEFNNEQQSMNNDPLNINIKQEIEIPDDNFHRNASVNNGTKERSNIRTEFVQIDCDVLYANETNDERHAINDRSVNIKKEIDDHHKSNSMMKGMEGNEVYENKEIKPEEILSLHTELDMTNEVSNNEINIQDNPSVNNHINSSIKDVNHEKNNSSRPGEDYIGKNKIFVRSLTTTKTIRSKRVNLGERLYNCEKCNETFKRIHDFKVHSRMHTGKILYKCKFCDKLFIKKSLFERHNRTHTGEKPYECEFCNKSFSQKENLKTHSKTHTGEKTHSYTGEKPFKCELCDKSFIQKSGLLTHIKTHTGEKPFKCEICNKSFSQKGNLLYHNKIHTGEKPFECKICNKTFRLKSILEIHNKVHDGEKSFKCDVCNKAFNQKSNLETHKKIHTGEKPFTCEYCNKSFIFKCKLNLHIKSHTGEKTFECDVCNKTFSIKGNLDSHKKIHTGEKSIK